MKKKLSFLAPLLLTGCFATAQPMFLPDGSSGYRISCDNYLSGTQDCLQKAGDVCGSNGYQMYDQSGHLKNEDSQNQSVIAAINSTPAIGSRSSKPVDSPKLMFIKCKSMDM